MDSQMDPADKMAIAKQLCTISHIVSSKNPSRKEMYEAARKLTLALESPEETMHRIAYLVPVSFQHPYSQSSSTNADLNCALLASPIDHCPHSWPVRPI